MKKFIGIIVSNKMQKTVVVRVDSLKMHSKYRKQYKVSKRYKAHDEEGTCKIGDVVALKETRPLSRTKRWSVIKLIKRSSTDDGIINDGISEE
ncbi:MAG: 30S ribosomal protein S17 [Patescibacteria group bacterium]|mgnify:CR=1 FL=1